MLPDCQACPSAPFRGVLNNSPKVGKATRAKIQKIIDELNYHPNPQARGLAARRSYLLGMIYDNPDALYINDVQRGVLSVCREFGYELVVHPCDMKSDTLIDEAAELCQPLETGRRHHPASDFRK